MADAKQRLNTFEKLSFGQMDGLYNLALHWTHNRADAEDLVQETYLRAFTRFHQFRIGSNFRAWIFTILRNTAINQHRRAKASAKSVDFDAVEGTLATDPPRRTLGHSASFTAGDVAAAVTRLPAEYRLTVALYYVEGFTYGEIAGIMGCPIGTVMSRLCRARRKLRSDLEGPSGEQEPTAAAS